MRRWMWGLSVVLGLTVATTGCDKLKALAKEKAAQQLKQNTGKQSGEAPQAVPGQAAADAKLTPEDKRDMELGEKLNDYIECLNNAGSEVSRAAQRYFSWADHKKGITGKERIVYGLYNVNDSSVERCTKALAAAKAKPPPQPEIETAAADFEVKLTAVLPKIAEAVTYYQSGEYKTDKLTKGKLLHQPLTVAFDAFEAADKKLRNSMSTLKDGMAQRELVRMEKTSGKNLAYLAKAMLIPARDLVRTGSPDGDVKVAPKAFEKSIEQYATSVRSMDAYATKNKKEAQAIGEYAMFINDCRKFESSARTMLEYLNGKKFSTGDRMMINNGNGKMIAGHPDHFVEAFNDLIQRSNKIEW
jgi:hypothetical protein